MNYIYNHNLLFPNEGKMFPEPGELPSSIECKEMTLECINIRPAGNQNFMHADTWEFQVRGHGDTWYHTHYNWSIIEATPENQALARIFHKIHEQRAQLQLEATRVFNKIRNLKHMKDEQ